jgi:hypothetical protein
MTILLGVIALFAVLCWVVAAVQAIAIMRLTSKEGHSWGDFLIGWWKFDAIRAKAGPGAEPYLVIYKRAILAFVAFILLGLILSGWAVNQSPAPASAAAQPRLINDPRIIPAEFAFNTDLRRVATMPGAPKILES